MSILHQLSAFTCLLLAIGLTGCEKGSPMSEVTGSVSLADGTKLSHVAVEFWPVGEGARASGMTDESGKFTLELDDKSRKGAAVGLNKVVLRDMWPSKDDVLSEGGDWIDNSKGKKPRIHNKYYNVTTTTMELEVKAGEANNFDITADPRR